MPILTQVVTRPPLFASIFSLSLLGALWLGLQGQTAVSEKHAFDVAKAQTKVITPAARPVPSQEHIDFALELFNIAVPSTAEHPVYDPKLADRGLTSKLGYARQLRVTIGPAAFESWAMLGSTLAHELEVHCHQNFTMIFLLDTIGFDGTGEAERQAYLHELRSAKRFGLMPLDSDLIRGTMAYFYPSRGSDRRDVWRLPLRRWLARNVFATDNLAIE